MTKFILGLGCILVVTSVGVDPYHAGDVCFIGSTAMIYAVLNAVVERLQR